METSIFLSSPPALVFTFVILLILSFLLLRCISNSRNRRPAPDLPFDIVIEILSHLPVRSLIRFKSVSKLWNQIISTSPYLVTTHRIRNNRRKGIICNHLLQYPDNRYQHRTVLISSPDKPFPLVDCDRSHAVICSSGDLGLLLLQIEHQHYALWNPATRQVKHLPHIPSLGPHKRSFVDACGVGLDPVSNAVKVVLVRNYNSSVWKNIAAVYVYTLVGGWRKLAGEDWPCSLVRSTHLNGSIYWFCISKPEYDLVTFDLGTEVFRRVSLRPLYDLYHRNSITGPYIYRDSIAVFWSETLVHSIVDVWLLNEEFCWIQHSSIGPFAQGLEVRGCWNDDRLVALQWKNKNPNGVVVFDTNEKSEL